MKLKLKDMATNNVIEFEGFKLKMKNFRFKSRNEMNAFFDEALIESPFKFIRLQNQLFLEKMHVLFSWMMISKILSFALFVPALIAVYYSAPQWIGISIVCLSIFFFMRSKWLSKKLDNIAIAKTFFNEMADHGMESLEEVRQDLINDAK